MTAPAVHHDFPANPANHNHLTNAVLQWADRNGVQLRAPQERQDSYRAVLDLAANHLDVTSVRWRLFATHVLAEYVEDTSGERPDEVRRKQLLRLVAMHGAVRVLAALSVALAAPLDEARWSFVEALFRYAASVLRGWQGGRIPT